MNSGDEVPNGLKLENCLVHGSRIAGLYEIKYHNPKRLNAIDLQCNFKMSELVNKASQDDSIKAVMIYGSKNMFSSGNDLQASAKNKEMLADPFRSAELYTVKQFGEFIGCVTQCKKPTIVVVRGRCIGMSFTQASNADFIYCTPEATFQTPFMKSYQSPEGQSTRTFPEQFGTRMAAEILLCDKVVSAQEALKTGFVNEILPSSLT